MGFEIGDAKKAAVALKAMAGEIDITNHVGVVIRQRPLRIEISWYDPEEMRFPRRVAGFTLIEQPNCCGALISTLTFVDERYRGQGIGQEMMKLKEAIAREYGYSALTATVRMDNPAELHILEKTGWQKGWEFVNARTTNRVGFFFKNLP